MRADLRHAVDLLDLGDRLLEQAVVLDRDLIAVAQDGGIYAVEGGRVALLADEIVKRLLTRDEFCLMDVGDQIDPGADALGLGLGVVLVDVDKDLIFLFQIDDHDMDVIQHKAEGAHNNQARHRDADRREGHEPMQEHAAEALTEQISDIILFHVSSTRPFRR